MLCYYNIIICIVGFLQLCYCQRRLVSGIDSIIGKKYMVYFVQSPFTKNFQNSWVCGGALVTPTQILTAAACLIEAENIYAIAGYKKYLKADFIENDKCTRTKKQRVVKVLIPTGYKLDYENPAQRMNIDIGVAIVEKPYNFSDSTYLTHCSYEPQSIMVNYENKHELINTRAVALGWGVTGKTEQESRKEMKYQLLQETSTMIVDKTICTNISDTPDIINIINKYHLCGTINVHEITKDAQEIQSFDVYKMRSQQSSSEYNEGGFKDYFGYRRSYNYEDNSEPRREEQIESYSPAEQNMTNVNDFYTRRALHLNNCQNNLGSPLIKWIHDREVIIGITSSTNMNSSCNGPFLYVSTAAASNIIKCLLETNIVTRKLCNRKIHDEPYEIQEIEIKWPDYEQSKILERMLLRQRAVLDKLQPLVPRATIRYINYVDINSTKKYNTKKRSIPATEREAQNERLSQSTYNENPQLRAQLPSILSRDPMSLILKRPQYHIDSRHHKNHQYESLSEELSSARHDKKNLRPQVNLKSDHPYQVLQNLRESRLDTKYDPRAQQNSKHRQNHNPQEVFPYIGIKQQYKPQSLKYDSLSGDQKNPLKEEPYNLPLIEPQHEPLIRQKYQPTSIEHALELEQQSISKRHDLSQRQKNNAVSKHRLLTMQAEPLHSRQDFLSPTPNHFLQHEVIENEPIKQHEFPQPESLYDLSPEQNYGVPDLKPNQPSEFVVSVQPNQPYRTTTLSDDQYFSFDEIFSLLQEPSPESQPLINTSSHEAPLKQLYGIELKDSTPYETYKDNENDEQHGIYKSRTETPVVVAQDEIMIRPQRPMN